MGPNRGRGGRGPGGRGGRGAGGPPLLQAGSYDTQVMELTDTVLATNIEDLEKLLTEAVSRPRERAFTLLINKAGKDKQVQKAEELFKIMQRGEFNFPPSAWSYTALLSAYERSNLVDKFEATFEEMQRRALTDPLCSPTAVTWFTVISMYEKNARWEKALELFEKLRTGEVRVEPDPGSCWFAIIDGYIKRGDFAAALNLLEEAHQRGLPRSSLMSSSSRTEVDRGMQKEPTYCRLLEHLVSDGRVEEATELFLGMQLAGVEATSASIRALLLQPRSGPPGPEPNPAVAYFAPQLLESLLTSPPQWPPERRTDVWKAICQAVQNDGKAVAAMAKVYAMHGREGQEDSQIYLADLRQLMRCTGVPEGMLQRGAE